MAAAHLRGEVEAPLYVEGAAAQVIAPVTALRRSPADGAMQDSQLLYGEAFRVYDMKGGWAWGQAESDDYVGYVLAEDLGAPLAPSHKLTALRSFIYRTPDIKTRPLMGVSFGAQLCVTGTEDRFAELADGGFIYAAHIAPLGQMETDWVAVARRFIGAPYFWGGRESGGLDCSALVQLALNACGLACPRDTYMQEAVLGTKVETDFDKGAGRYRLLERPCRLFERARQVASCQCASYGGGGRGVRRRLRAYRRNRWAGHLDTALSRLKPLPKAPWCNLLAARRISHRPCRPQRKHRPASPSPYATAPARLSNHG